MDKTFVQKLTNQFDGPQLASNPYQFNEQGKRATTEESSVVQRNGVNGVINHNKWPKVSNKPFYRSYLQRKPA